MTVTATKIDSSHESGKNFIIWAWHASTTIFIITLWDKLEFNILSKPVKN
jgi:hypothetical protein